MALEYMIPENSDVSDFSSILSGKSESELRKQSSAILAKLKRVNDDCRILNDKGEEVGFDYMKTNELDGGSSEDRFAETKRMTAERRAIRNHITDLVDRELIRREIESVDPTGLTVSKPSGEEKLEDVGKVVPSFESKAADKMFDVLKEMSSGSGPLSSQSISLPNTLKVFMERNPSITFEGLTVPNLINSSTGTIAKLQQFAPRADTLTEGGTGAGYHPYPYQETRVALMTSEIIAWSGVPQRRSTGGKHNFEYLQEDDQTLNAGRTTENPNADFVEADFDVNKKTDALRKIASSMSFTVEQMSSVDNLIFFATTRLIRAVANQLESDLISGNDNNGGSNQIRGLENYEAGTAQAATTFGYDEIHSRIMTMEDVMGQRASVILMRGDNIHQVKTLHVGQNDGRYIMGGPADKGPNMLWDIPVLKVPKLSANTVFLIDPAPIVIYDDGSPMQVEFSPHVHFLRDKWVMKTSIYAQQVFTRFVPSTGNLAKKYVSRINSFKAANT